MVPPKVFINFRGKDQAGFAVHVDARLTEEFGSEAIFLSSRSIPPGDDFDHEIRHTVRQCSVLLALIGPDWIAHARKRAADGEDEVDWVYLEIAEALAHGVRVIPILVEGASMPRAEELPPEIVPMIRCQYLRLHHRNVRHDMELIVETTLRAVPGLVRAADGEREATVADAGPFWLPGSDRCRIAIAPGNLLGVTDTDIWTNSENTDMEMSRFNEFTISGLIRYWGARRDDAGRVTEDLIADELHRRVGARRPVSPATTVVTGPGSLAESHHVRHIIHVASVRGEPGAGFYPVVDQRRCVGAVLAEAERLAGADARVRSILIPMLGAGTGRANARDTAATIVDAVVDYLAAHPQTALERVSLLAYSRNRVRMVEEALRARGLAESPAQARSTNG